MARWLVKEEPTHYSFADLAKDGGTEWNGVHNALALRHLRGMKPGDAVLYYHTGEERAIVGVARVAGTPYEDPEDDRGSWSVRIEADRPLRRPVPLLELRADPALASFDLVRIGRLSVMPVSAEQWARILAREKTPVAAAQSRAAERRPNRRRANARKRGST